MAKDSKTTPSRPPRGEELREEERIRWRAVAWATICYLAVLMMAVLLCILLGGCTTTKYVTVPEYHTDTLKVSHNVHDSIYVHDSTFIKAAGDTLLIERWHTQYRDRWKTDTVYQHRVDSVPLPYPVEKKVEKELSTWQSFRMTLGTIALCLLAVYVVYRIIRKKFFPPAL
jgi:ABC-type Fe3+ transport system permease subunit